MAFMSPGFSSTGTTTVLFIDGNDQDRHYFVDRLRIISPEYRILEALDGQAGLAIYGSRPVQCVILELDLPDMSGFEVLIKLVPVARRPNVPVIVLTRLHNKEVLNLAIANGAQQAFCKPLTSGDVLDQAVRKGVTTVGKVFKDTPEKRHEKGWLDSFF
ncbi:hypothetical protein W02_06000 [Nitrospira sp. KM1]|uniref:response regulator n=1 Tax=Nitrospira sp. KM1 TaxID=1936990 RepID=UPI0013A799E0|nr:response regulator [Nitrospira sp. KM1]BCA53460.1 hypothetical protein W02_06000 [Nitrospira sp. KM1]